MHLYERISVCDDKSHVIHSFSFIPLACAECDDSWQFSGSSSIPLCYVLFPATLLHQLFFHSPSLHFAIYFLVYLCTFSCHPSPPTILPFSLTSFCHLFLGLPLYLFLPPFSTNYSSILPHFILPSISWSTAVLFPATLLHQLFLHPPSLHLAIYFLVYL